MAYLDMTAANAALKELYGPQVIQNMAYKDNPFFAMVHKVEDAGGKYIPFPTVWSSSQGRSSNFANAQANQTAPQLSDFLLTLKPDYALATIANQLLEAGATDREAFLKPAKLNIDNAIISITNSVASSLFRSGTGSIGQSNGMTSGVITLADPETVTQFERNMVLQANATDGGASPRAALGYVIAVNRIAGTVTVSATGLGGAAGNPASWSTGANGDFLVVQGDNNAKPAGLAGWLPTTAPASGDNFFGVDRSVDTRLGGIQFDGRGLNIEEALIDCSKYVAREGGRPNLFVTNYTSYSALEKALGSKVRYTELRNGEIMFKGITVNGHKGPIDVWPDRNCPGLVGYMLQSDTWDLLSTNEVPHINRADGLEMLRVSNADALEVRVVAYYQLGCNAPGWNAVAQLPN